MRRPTSAPFRHPTLILLLATASAATLLATARPSLTTGVAEVGAPHITTFERPRLLIVSVDGLRPDMIRRANVPNIRALLETGSFSLRARGTSNTPTLPSHVGMLTGCAPRRHQIGSDDDLPSSGPHYPKVPTLFDLAKRAGYTTALAAGRANFGLFNRHGSIDHFSAPVTAAGGDGDVRDAAVGMIGSYRPEVMVVHFAAAGDVGDPSGSATFERFDAIATADRYVGDVLRALDDAGLRKRTTVLLTCNRGDVGLPVQPEDRPAPDVVWVLNGPGVRKHFDLSSLATVTVEAEDTFATACGLLDITPPVLIDGKPISQALTDPSRLRTRTTSR